MLETRYIHVEALPKRITFLVEISLKIDQKSTQKPENRQNLEKPRKTPQNDQNRPKSPKPAKTAKRSKTRFFVRYDP